MSKVPSLSGARSFTRVMRDGRVVRRGVVTVAVLRREDAGPARLGLAVKAAKAVVRNRVRRRLREAWRMCDVPEGLDVVIRAGDGAAVTPLGALVGDLESALAGASEAAA